MSITALPEPRQDADDPHGLRILPYVTIHILEQFAEQGNFPDEYKPYLIDAVRRITEAGNE